MNLGREEKQETGKNLDFYRNYIYHFYMENIIKLNLIAEKISLCTKCPDFVENRLKTVPGNGNPHASIVILGEGAGKDESEQGIPFCGRSGKLLNNILEACGLNRNDIFVTNICKCRPPNNRTPLPFEIENCQPFLELQLRVINPKYIICLGTTAAQSLLKTDISISNLRGKWHSYVNPPVNAKVLASFHPSYALRNSSSKVEIYNDIMKVVEDSLDTSQ